MLDARCSSLIGSDDVADWGPGELEALLTAGLLRPAGMANAVECECEAGGLEDVIFVDGAEGEGLRAYIVCREGSLGRVKVPLERLRRWRTDPAGLARYLAAQFDEGTRVDECVPERLWWLGRPIVGNKRCDLFLARGATWGDADEVFGAPGAATGCTRAVVLVPRQLPTGALFTPSTQVVCLGRVLSLGDGALRVDVSVVQDAMAAEQVAAPLGRQPVLVIDGVSVEYRNQRVMLSSLPLQLLKALAHKPGALLSHFELAEAVWGDAGTQYLDQLRGHVKTVNDAFIKAGSTTRLIRPKKGTGYLLDLGAEQVSCD